VPTVVLVVLAGCVVMDGVAALTVAPVFTVTVDTLLVVVAVFVPLAALFVFVTTQ
jgi:hypothetical protein